VGESCRGLINFLDIARFRDIGLDEQTVGGEGVRTPGIPCETDRRKLVIKTRAVHTNHPPALRGEVVHGGAANAACRAGDQHKTLLCAGHSHLFVYLYTAFRPLVSNPRPSIRFLIVLKCTRSQAAGLELAL
jgi:hypothetical protein